MKEGKEPQITTLTVVLKDNDGVYSMPLRMREAPTGLRALVLARAYGYVS